MQPAEPGGTTASAGSIASPSEAEAAAAAGRSEWRAQAAGFVAVWGLTAAVLLAGASAQIRLYSRGPAFAAAVIVAFVLQLGLYWLPGFPILRKRLEAAVAGPARIGVIAVALLFPYLVYGLGTGAAAPIPALKLIGLVAVVLGLYGLFPVKRPGLAWQDVAVMAAIAAPMYVNWYRDVWPVPVYLDVMARLLVVALAAFAVLTVRGLPDVGYEWRLQAGDWLEGARQFVFYSLIALPLGWAMRFIAWHPRHQGALAVVLSFIGIFLFIAVAEELFFRGILQNLLEKSMDRPLAARAIASAIFGLSHIHHGFPNWRYVLMAAIAGWFYGTAWHTRRSIVAASVTHALVDTAWHHWFTA